MIQQSAKRNVSEFIDQLNTRREAMDAERIVMSDTDFGLLYRVSCSMVSKYMGTMDKNISYRSTIKFVPMSEINDLRKTHTDSYVAQKYNSSLDTINRYFGSRESLGLSSYRKSGIEYKNSITSINKRLKATQPVLNQERWEYRVDIPDWMTEDVIISGDSPHPFLYQKIS